MRAPPNGGPVQQPIVTALARARRWQEMLDAGQVASVTELADRLNVDRSCASRILPVLSLPNGRLNLPAPNIVEAILGGREPSGLSLAKLTQTFPVLWNEQWEMLGFPSA